MTRPRKPRANHLSRLAAWMIEHSFATGHGDTVEDLLGELSAQVQELRARRPKAKAGGSWLFVPAGKVAFLRDIAAHRKNAREGMRKYRAAQKAAGLLSEDAVKIGRRE